MQYGIKSRPYLVFYTLEYTCIVYTNLGKTWLVWNLRDRTGLSSRSCPSRLDTVTPKSCSRHSSFLVSTQSRHNTSHLHRTSKSKLITAEFVVGRLGSVGASWVIWGSRLGLVPAIAISAVSVILISCTRPPCLYRLRKN